MYTRRTPAKSTLVLIAVLHLLRPVNAASGKDFDIANSDEAGLIAAMNEANGNGEPNVINLAENGIYTLTMVDNMTDGPNGLPSVVGEIVINGNGSIIRRSAGAVPNFRVVHVAASGNLTLNDMVVRNGRMPDGTTFAGRSGAGILNAGMLTLNRCTVEDNRTGGGGFSGGFSGNSGGAGGGIYNLGMLMIDASTIQGKRTGNGEGGTEIGGNGGSGGGIYNAGILTLNHSTLNANQTGTGGTGNMGNGSAGSGGGIMNGSGGDSTINTSTISQNVAGIGGGIRNAAQLFVTGSTITENSNRGVSNGADFDMRHTSIANQTTGEDCFGLAPLSLGHNLDSDNTCGLAATGDQSGMNPMLGPLQDNGGSTHTHAPQMGSPAIDADDTASDKTDQRGFLRAFDGDGDGTVAADIGAVEYYDCDDDMMNDITDEDADTIPDGCDECPGEDDLLDTDTDGVVDCLDSCPNDASDDSDGDGVCDSDDICDGDDTIDSDGDGEPDDCDDTPTGDPTPITDCCGGMTPMMTPFMLIGWCWMRRRKRRN